VNPTQNLSKPVPLFGRTTSPWFFIAGSMGSRFSWVHNITISDHDLSLALSTMGPGGAGRGANHLILDATLVGAADDAEETLLAPVPGWSRWPFF